ncbi:MULTISPECIES: hemerythrin domain-containing protein [unclassified Massilia]|uniref:hemerythrin domain-containing protein n=1 Tax=unclassified Massilia TaxID=2609279 RepID=UPI0009E800EF|nr:MULTISPECIES: hemerythrin domain-containing protein [unclassified Massilia]
MLTSTYTLVALSVEQTTVRSALQSLARTLHALPEDGGILAPGQAAQLCAELRQVVDDCHWRKLDKFLVPALRRASCAADGLLHDLEQISRGAAESLAAAEACVDAGARGVDRDRFQEAVEGCIAALRCRLEREEHELFPLARSLVRGEAWFAIANQMLAHDAVARERRGALQHGRARPEPAGPRRHIAEPLGHAHEPAGPEFGRRHATLSMLH